LYSGLIQKKFKRRRMIHGVKNIGFGKNTGKQMLSMKMNICFGKNIGRKMMT